MDTGSAVLLFLSFELGAGLCGCPVGHDTIHMGLALYDLWAQVEAEPCVEAEAESRAAREGRGGGRAAREDRGRG